MLARLEDPHLLICETCIATGARISEVTGLKIKHVDPEKGCVRIEQRYWRGDIDAPKTEKSRRTLALGNLADRYRQWIAKLEHKHPEAWVFPQDEDKRKPLWDSGVRQALKKAAVAEGCDFPGLGPHSFRRANITWRQEVGGSSIEVSRIAGHASTKITEDYTVVQIEAAGGTDPPDLREAGEGGQAREERQEGSRHPERGGGVTIRRVAAAAARR